MASESEELLRDASANGDLKTVTRLVLHENVVVDATDQETEYTALLCACRRGRPGVAKFLLEHGANIDAVDQYGNTAMELALGYGHQDVAVALLKQGNVNEPDAHGRTPLWLAAAARDAICCGLDWGRTAGYRNLANNEKVMVHLYLVACDQVDVKADDGTTPLMELCSTGKATFDLVTSFIERNADVNAIDNEGATPLIHLCRNIEFWKVDPKVLRLLVTEHHADVNVKEGNTPVSMRVAA